MCVCVCVRERERQTDRVRERQRHKDRHRQTETDQNPGFDKAVQQGMNQACPVSCADAAMTVQQQSTIHLAGRGSIAAFV